METAPYVEANLGRAVTVRELADAVELSTHHFLRMLKKSLGLTPYQYSLERLVERSKDLLRSKRASLAEVTLCIGFGSHSHFTTVFRRAVGATPAEIPETGSKGNLIGNVRSRWQATSSAF
jgi:AraC family transcriptional regulator